MARLRESLALLPFCINEAEATDTQAITVFNFVLCFFSMFFVCLFMFTFFLPFSLPVPSPMPTLSERVFAIGPK